MPAATYDTYGAVAGGVGGVLQLVSTIIEGQQAKKRAEYNARVAQYNAQVGANAARTEGQQARYNAAIAEQDALLASQAAAFREQQIRLLNRRRQSQNRAVIGASGVTFQGSPLEVLTENAFQAETEALLVRYEGQLQSLAQQRRAALLTYQADVKDYEAGVILGQGRQQAGLLRAGGQEAVTGSTLRALGVGVNTIGTALRQYRPPAPPGQAGLAGNEDF